MAPKKLRRLAERYSLPLDPHETVITYAMNSKTPQLHFLIVSLIAISIIVFLIFRPFLYTLILAATFAVLFWPIYERLLALTRRRRSIAALLTTLLVVIFILTPLAIVGVQIFLEAWQLYLSISQDGGNGIFGAIKNFAVHIQKIIPAPVDISTDANQYLQNGLTWLLGHFGVLFSSIAQLALHAFLFLFSFYYLLKDGVEIKKKILLLSPLADADDEKIFKKLHSAINSVVRGSLLIAVIQGTVAGIGLSIFGVPNPMLWGSLATITSLLPAVGTSLVTVPAIAFLFMSGATAQAIGLTIWALTAVGLIDNMLSPKLMERRIQIHPLLILLSALGGIAFFGPVGFLLGPLTLSLLFALFETYLSLAKKE